MADNIGQKDAPAAVVEDSTSAQEHHGIERRATIGIPAIRVRHHTPIMAYYNRMSYAYWIQAVIAIIIVALAATLFGKPVRDKTGRHSVFSHIHGVPAAAGILDMAVVRFLHVPKRNLVLTLQ